MLLVAVAACGLKVARTPSQEERPRKTPAWAKAAPGTTFDERGRPREVIDRHTAIELVLIPAGRYIRGAEEGFEVPAHPVTISRAFYLAKYELTQAQWRSVMGELTCSMCDYGKGDDRPVHNVDWPAAQEFLHKTGFRLPTDAEWEYACRAGTTRETYGPVDEVAWHYENAEGVVQPVGQKRPNAFGLYDMLGNVCEWCSDRFDEDEYSRCQNGGVDPTGPSAGEERVLRGLHVWAGSGTIGAHVRYGGRTRVPSGEECIAWQGLRVARDP